MYAYYSYLCIMRCYVRIRERFSRIRSVRMSAACHVSSCEVMRLCNVFSRLHHFEIPNITYAFLPRHISLKQCLVW